MLKKFGNSVLIDMNNGSAIAIFGFLIDHNFMQRKRWEEKQPAGPHGVLAIIDDDHAETLFNVEDFQTLMPVVVAYAIGKKPAE